MFLIYFSTIECVSDTIKERKIKDPLLLRMVTLRRADSGAVYLRSKLAFTVSIQTRPMLFGNTRDDGPFERGLQGFATPGPSKSLIRRRFEKDSRSMKFQSAKKSHFC